MRPILVVYATRGGHTRRIAERVADRIRTLRHEAQVQDARTEALPPLERYSAVVLAAGVHLGHHEREMVRFVRARRKELETLPTLLLSVSLTEAAAVDVHRPDDERLEARRAVLKSLEEFGRETGWRPDVSAPVAGALTDSAVGPLTRALLRALSPGDTPDVSARQVVFTDWVALNGHVDALVRHAVEQSASLPLEPDERPAFRSAEGGAVFTP